jgi:hypothetical protein
MRCRCSAALRIVSKEFDQLREEHCFEFGTEVAPSAVSVSLSPDSEPKLANLVRGRYLVA